MNGTKIVDSSAMDSLTTSLEDSVIDYLTNYNKLKSVVEDVRLNAIKGQVADALVSKFEEKEEIFKAIEKTINEAADAMSRESLTFKSRLNNLMSGMR